MIQVPNTPKHGEIYVHGECVRRRGFGQAAAFVEVEIPRVRVKCCSVSVKKRFEQTEISCA